MQQNAINRIFRPQLGSQVRVPKWFGNQPVVVYLLALLFISVWYSQYSMPWFYMLSGVVAVLVFFMVGNTAIRRWSAEHIHSAQRFEKRLFWVSFGVRLLWMVLIYIVFQNVYEDAFGFENADATYYNDTGIEVADALRDGRFGLWWQTTIKEIDISDLGYAVYVGVLYFLTNDSIIVVRLLKCVYSAYTVVLIYRLAKRNFGESTGRIAAIFCMLWPNFWYYCGCHLKETEMVFLSVLFVEQTDIMLKTRNFSAWKVIPILLISAALFTIRTPLAVLSILSLLFSIVMSSTRVVSWGKRIIIGLLALILVVVTMGNSIMEETDSLINTAQSNAQQQNYEWRTVRDNGNAFAKFASKTVFAPMIFTIPFPTMVNAIQGENMQHLQQLLNGGNFCKNILSFFTILSLFMLLFSGQWREHLVPLSFMLGYMVILAMSTFAQSERFHQPTMPLEMIFAAFGLVQALQGVPIKNKFGSKKKYKRWFMIWLAVMFVAAIAWNWFKLAGRGLL